MRRKGRRAAGSGRALGPVGQGGATWPCRGGAGPTALGCPQLDPSASPGPGKRGPGFQVKGHLSVPGKGSFLCLQVWVSQCVQLRGGGGAAVCGPRRRVPCPPSGPHLVLSRCGGISYFPVGGGAQSVSPADGSPHSPGQRRWSLRAPDLRGGRFSLQRCRVKERQIPGGLVGDLYCAIPRPARPALEDLLWERPAARPPFLLPAPLAFSAPLCRSRLALQGARGPEAGPRTVGSSQGPGSTRWV